MGFVLNTLRPRRSFGPEEETLLWNLIQIMNRVDGVVEPAEMQVAEALSRTVPQLRSGRSDPRPVLSRKAILDEVAKIGNEPLRRQLYVVAIEAALSSGDVNESEDQYLDHLRRALNIDDAYATKVIEVLGCKYGR